MSVYDDIIKRYSAGELDDAAAASALDSYLLAAPEEEIKGLYDQGILGDSEVVTIGDKRATLPAPAPVAAPAAASAPAEGGFLSSLGKVPSEIAHGVPRGFLNAGSSLVALGQGLEGARAAALDVAGFPGAAEKAREFSAGLGPVKENVIAAAQALQTEESKKQHTLSDVFTNPAFVAGAAAEQTPYLMLGGIPGMKAAAAAPTLAGKVAANLSKTIPATLPFELGASLQAQEDKGQPMNLLTALPGAAAATAVENLPEVLAGSLLRGVAKTVGGKVLSEQVAKQSVADLVTKFLKEGVEPNVARETLKAVARGLGSMGLATAGNYAEEYAQTIAERAAAQVGAGESILAPEILTEAHQSGLAGAAGGGGMAAVPTAVGTAAEIGDARAAAALAQQLGPGAAAPPAAGAAAPPPVSPAPAAPAAPAAPENPLEAAVSAAQARQTRAAALGIDPTGKTAADLDAEIAAAEAHRPAAPTPPAPPVPPAAPAAPAGTPAGVPAQPVPPSALREQAPPAPPAAPPAPGPLAQPGATQPPEGGQNVDLRQDRGRVAPPAAPGLPGGAPGPLSPTAQREQAARGVAETDVRAVVARNFGQESAARVTVVPAKADAQQRVIAAVQKATGREVHYVAGAPFDGVRIANGKLFIAEDATKPLLYVFGHELGHSGGAAAKGKYLARLQRAATEQGFTSWAADHNAQRQASGLAALEGDALWDEFGSDWLGERMGTDAFWKLLSRRDRGLFRDLAEWVIGKLKDMGLPAPTMAEVFKNPAAMSDAVRAAADYIEEMAAETEQEQGGEQFAGEQEYSPRKLPFGQRPEGEGPKMSDLAGGFKEEAQPGKRETRMERFLREHPEETRRPAEAEPVKKAADWSVRDQAFRDSKVRDRDGNLLVVYHGGKRPDRIGSIFREDRATSGPMAFFTDNPETASGYATSKADTSLEPPDDYAGWFKFRPAGSRSMVDIDRVWYFLTSEQRAAIVERLPHVTNYDATGNDLDGYRLGGPTEYGLSDSRHWEWNIKEARGNVLKAAKEIWLNGGSLVAREEEFLEVLRLGGLDGVQFDSPHRENPAVFPVYLNITKPLDTVAGVTPELVADLQALARRQRRKREAPGADMWDKTTRDAREWVRVLDEDRVAGTNSFVWSSIPDWVTDYLKSKGFDGIHDVGGKSGGVEHSVWIPFYRHQVKSATGNVGTYGQRPPTHEEARPLGMTAKQAAKAQEQGDIRFSPPRTPGQAEQDPQPPSLEPSPVRGDKFVKNDAHKGNAWRQNLATIPPEIQAVVREHVEAEDYADFEDSWRRYSQDELYAAGMARLKDSKELQKLARYKPGQAVDHGLIVALGNMELTQFDRLKSAKEAYAASSTNENLLALQQAMTDVYAWHARAAGARAEAGRTLAAAKFQKRLLRSSSSKDRILAALARGNAMLTQDELAALALLPDSDPVALVRFMGAALRDRKFAKLDWINAYRYANMLSGTNTHAMNLISNAAWLGDVVVAQPVAAIVDMAKGLATGKRELFMQDYLAGLVGSWNGLGVAAQSALEILRQGYSQRQAEEILAGDLDKWGGTREAPGGGRNPMNWTGRLLAAGDALFSVPRYLGAAQQYATRQALKEGLSGTALEARVRELIETGEVHQQAQDAARRATFTDKAFFSSMINAKRQTNPAGVFVVSMLLPFIRVAENITRRGLGYTPGVGALRSWKGDGKAQQIVAEQIIGVGITALAYAAAAAGLATGAPPEDPEERDAFYASGKIPYGLKIGSTWVRWNRLGPIAFPFAVGTAINDKKKSSGMFSFSEKELTEVTNSVGSMFSNMSLVRNIADVADAVTNPTRAGASWAENTVGQIIPAASLMRQLEKLVEPHFRDPENVYQKMMSGVPWMSKLVPEKVSTWGQPLEKSDSGLAAFSPFIPGKGTSDPVVREAARVGAKFPNQPPRQFTRKEGGKDMKYELSQGERRDYNKVTGGALYAAAAKKIGGEAWVKMTDAQRKKVLDLIVEKQGGARRDAWRARFLHDHKGQGVAR